MRKPKTPKVPGLFRRVLAENVAALMARHYHELPNRTAQQKRLAKEAGVSYSSVQRIMEAATGASIDNVEAIANAFDLSAYQILIPSLNVINPQVVRGALKEEERLYRRMQMTTEHHHKEKA